MENQNVSSYTDGIFAVVAVVDDGYILGITPQKKQVFEHRAASSTLKLRAAPLIHPGTISHLNPPSELQTCISNCVFNTSTWWSGNHLNYSLYKADSGSLRHALSDPAFISQ